MANEKRSLALYESLASSGQGYRAATTLNETLAQKIETDRQAMAQEGLRQIVGEIAGIQGGESLAKLGEVTSGPGAEAFYRRIKNGSQMT